MKGLAILAMISGIIGVLFYWTAGRFTRSKKNMFIGGVLIILSIIMMFVPFRLILKNPTEGSIVTYCAGVIFGILLGIVIFVIGIIQKFKTKQKNS